MFEFLGIGESPCKVSAIRMGFEALSAIQKEFQYVSCNSIIGYAELKDSEIRDKQK